MTGTEMLSMYLWCFGIVGLITVIMMALGGLWESHTKKKDTDFLWVYDDLSVKSLEEDLEKTKDPVVANYIKKLLKQKKGV